MTRGRALAVFTFLLGPATAGADQRVTFGPASSGVVSWPVIGASPEITAWILPLHEGSYVPADNPEWIEHLVNGSPLNTTEGLSMPWIAVQGEGFTVTHIFENPFHNALTFASEEGRLTARMTHTFTASGEEYTVTAILGSEDVLAPARAYRRWLIGRGEFISMRDKIARTPRAERLLGAAHVYLWGDDLLAREDVSDWRAFASRLASAESDSLAGRVFSLMNDEARQAAAQLPAAEWPDSYNTGLVAQELSRILAERGISPEAFRAEFPDLLGDPATWGDGYSTKMLDAFQEAGLDRLWLGLPGWEGAMRRPHVAAHAGEIGHLMATYDSYHSIHSHGTPPDQTWPTAQLDEHLWETGGVMNADGSYSTGFRGRGRHLSPLAARPHVERRVREIMARVPFSSWFMDCDAFGELFDDFHPLHPATMRGDMEARLGRMAWIRDTFGLVIGSEGGSAYATPVIHFAHGMMTPVIGWGDPRLTGRDSPYYLGQYHPPDGPRVFMQPVPLAPGYEKFHFDPRFRLPLYEAVFHDSVVATHQWGSGSLKFSDQVVTNALLEALYQVPPLYHLNLREWRRLRDQIVARYEFWSPLHRITGLLPLTEFEWLTADRLVQRTQFGDRIEVIANFGSDEWTNGEARVPGHSVWARDMDSGAATALTPQP